MLAILCAAGTGQQIHIYTEDPQHFAAFCPADGAETTDDGAFSARHDVDNFCFCPYMGAAVAEPEFRAVVLGVLETFVTRCRCGAVQRCSRCGPLRVSDPAESSFGRSFPSLFIFRFMPRGRFRAVHPFQRHISTL